MIPVKIAKKSIKSNTYSFPALPEASGSTNLEATKAAKATPIYMYIFIMVVETTLSSAENQIADTFWGYYKKANEIEAKH